MKKQFVMIRSVLLAAGWLGLATVGLAQDPQSGETPKPAAKAYGPIGEDNQDPNQSPDALQPDERPLTGFQQPTVGTPMERHSYWVPGVSYYNFIQSSGETQGGSQNWNSTSYIGGNISLLENWSRSQLLLNYSGGGNFSSDSSLGNGWYQQLSASETFNWERWQLTLLDDFSYLPQSQFGFGAGSGIASPGVGGTLGGGTTGLGAGFSPGQSIFTAVGPRYTNTAGVQVNYMLTPKSSVTVGGLFSVLRFTESGNIESNDYVGNAGYNYQITRADTIGLVYRFSSFHYIGFSQAIGDQTFQAAYGRKITGRLALQLSGGPEITNFKVPQGTSTKTQYVAASGSATLTYAFPKGTLSASYNHGVTSGSGVFLGATTDQVTGTLSRKLSRVWSGDAHLGFARNRNAETDTAISSQNFNTIYAGASVARPLGRNANFSLGYTAYIENANSTICAGSNCSSSFMSNQITVGLSWHARPFVLH
jgi:hypothetical protein